MDSERGELAVRRKIMVQSRLRLPAFTAATQVTNCHDGLRVDGDSDRPIIRIRLLVDAFDFIKNRIRFRHFFQRLALCHAPRLKAQRREFAPERTLRGCRLRVVTLLLDEPPPRLTSRQSPIKLSGRKRRVRLAGRLTHRPKIDL